MDTLVEELTDIWFEQLREESERRVFLWLDEHAPTCFEPDGDKIEYLIREMSSQLFEGWFKGEFDEYG